MSAIDWDKKLKDLTDILNEERKNLAKAVKAHNDAEKRVNSYVKMIENLSMTRDIRTWASTPGISLCDLLNKVEQLSSEIRELEYQVYDYRNGDAAAKAEARLSVAKEELKALKEVIISRFA